MHPGGTSEDLLNEVLRSSAGATERISSGETILGQIEGRMKTWEEIRHGMSSYLEDQLKVIREQCSMHVKICFKEQIGNWENTIAQGFRREFNKTWMWWKEM